MTTDSTTAAPIPSFARRFATTQRMDRYTHEDHEVWRTLYARRMSELEATGSRAFLDGASRIGLTSSSVPELASVNRRLSARTGWRAMPVAGFIEAADFFRCLSMRLFPTTVIVRSMSQLEYLPEPDIFHDVFGHVPLHADPAFARFLQTFGEVASLASTPEAVQQMARLFWFTVEFGLVQEDGATRIYGSGLISSAGDAENALSDRCERRPFHVDDVVEQGFEIDRLQDVLFVAENFEQIEDAVETMRGRLQAA